MAPTSGMKRTSVSSMSDDQQGSVSTSANFQSYAGLKASVNRAGMQRDWGQKDIPQGCQQWRRWWFLLIPILEFLRMCIVIIIGILRVNCIYAIEFFADLPPAAKTLCNKGRHLLWVENVAPTDKLKRILEREEESHCDSVWTARLLRTDSEAHQNEKKVTL